MTIDDALDLGRRNAGEITRLNLSLIEDGLGRPLPLPILVAKGRRDGPVLGLTAAVHGDELNGVAVIHRLFDQLDCRALRGTVVAVPVVSLPAFLRRARRFPGGVDLNHVWPGDAGGPMPHVYAERFAGKVLRHCDHLIDLHTASRGRINSLYVRADLNNASAAHMARLQRPQIILDNPPADRTLRGTAAQLGIPAVTVEVGDPQRFQPLYIRRALAGLRAVLADFGMIRRTQRRRPLPEPVICRRSRWLRTDAGGLLEVLPKVATTVQAGQPIARQTDIYGRLVRMYTAPEDGIVIGRSTDPVAETGARILHLGLAGDDPPVPPPLRLPEAP